METYPTNIPSPLYDGHSHQPGDPRSRTPMTLGTARVRTAEYGQKPTDLPHKVEMTATQAKTLRAFIKTAINGGSDWFLMPVFVDDEYRNVEVRFVRMPVYTPLRGGRWIVEFQVESRTDFYEAGDEALIP